MKEEVSHLTSKPRRLAAALMIVVSIVLIVAGPASAQTPLENPSDGAIAEPSQPVGGAIKYEYPSDKPGSEVKNPAGMSLLGLCNYGGDHPTISRGATGAAVSHLQCLLKNYWGYSSLSIDGIFGSATDSAVRNFQGSRGLTADGIVGTLTWNAVHP